ncbi:hypothetical protein D3C72_1517830 [compost metagenome]
MVGGAASTCTVTVAVPRTTLAGAGKGVYSLKAVATFKRSSRSSGLGSTVRYGEGVGVGLGLGRAVEADAGVPWAPDA